MKTKGKKKALAFAPSTFKDDGERAFGKLVKQLDALTPADLTPAIGVDAWYAANAALAAVERARPYVEQDELPGLSEEILDRIDTLAKATLHTNTLERVTSESSLSDIVAEARTLRRRMTLSVAALEEEGLIESVRPFIDGGRSYEALSQALRRMGRVFRQSWPKVHDKTALKKQDILRATKLADSIDATLRSDEAPAGVDYRARTLSELLREYGELQAAMRYLRRNEGDADQIVPALRRPRAARASDKREAIDVSVDSADTVAPEVVEVMPVSDVPEGDEAAAPVTVVEAAEC